MKREMHVDKEWKIKADGRDGLLHSIESRVSGAGGTEE